jgi:prepilin-type N-terminal cleavage/methylation domain-containing protein
MKSFEAVLSNKKGVTIIEITIVLLIIGILVVGWSFSEKGHYETAYREEGRALIQDIAAKEKIYATQHRNQYYVQIDTVSYIETGDAYMNIDARKNRYFKTFSIDSRTVEVKDGLGNLRALPVLLITAYGSGIADGKNISAVYNKYRDELEIKNNG